MRSSEIFIVNKTRMKMPSLSYLQMKKDILGSDYSLSVAYVNEKISQKINTERRGKNNPTNILSFALTKKVGEILLCPSVIKKEAPIFDKTFHQFLILIVIHGMLHLRGMRHGAKMEAEEKKFEKKYLSRTKF
ncbi:MAG: rRNA maturation RNase YbeY [Candidatus Paceibacterota bacterium]